MAELLLKAVDATHADPVKDKRGCYKRGMVVDVREDGATWGRLEVLPPAQGGKFVLVKIPGATVEQVEKAMGRLMDSSATLRRTLKIAVDSLPAGVKSTLNTTGVYSTTANAIKSYVQSVI